MRFVLPLAAILSVLCSCSSNQVARGRYSLQRASEPSSYVRTLSVRAIVGKALPGAVAMKPGEGRLSRGLSYRPQNGRQEVNIETTPFTSAACAEDAALTVLEQHAVRFEQGSSSGDVLGNHSWFSRQKDGSGMLILVSGNLLCQVWSSDYTLAEKLCRGLLQSISSREEVSATSSQPVIDRPKLRIKRDSRGANRYILTIHGKPKMTYRLVSPSGQVFDTKRPMEKALFTRERGSIQLKLVVRDVHNVISPVFNYDLNLPR